MEFLDKDTEKILKLCVDNEGKSSAVLAELFSGCSYYEETKLRSQIKLLKENGYISNIKWGDGLPLFYRIEQKGRNYFANREMNISAKLHKKDLASPVSVYNQCNFGGDNSPIQIGNIDCEQNIDCYFNQAQEAIEELKNHIYELELSKEQITDILNNLVKASDLVKSKKKVQLKTILKGVYDIIKDVGCSFVKGLLISKIQ